MALIIGDDLPASHSGTAENDTIRGLGGNDTLIGNAGDDRLEGGAGDDSLHANGGRDTVLGGGGNDTIQAVPGLSFHYGGGGDDLIRLDGIQFGPGGTQARAYGGDGNDTISYWAPANARTEGGDGDDVLGIIVSNAVNPAGAGLIDFSTGSGTFTGTSGQRLEFSGFERLHFQGGHGDDTVTGGAGNDTAFLYGGANRADMGAGDDAVQYRYGAAQTLEGGAGDDELITMDSLIAMYFIVDGLTGAVDDGQLSQITGFERFQVIGSDQHDTISTGAGADRVEGMRGDDSLYGMGGNDTLQGGGGDDRIWGGDGNDTLVGQAGDDVLYGGAGRDQLILRHGADSGFGGDGDDRIVFQAGNPIGWGEAGADVFLIRGLDPAWYANVGDYTRGEDRLLIDSALLPGATAGRVDPSLMTFGNQSVGSHGQFLHFAVLDDTFLFWDADGSGSGQPIAIASFLNGITLTASDLILI